MKIYQWVPAAHRGDAIGDSARRVRDLLRRMGHESELFALTIDDELRNDVRPFATSEAARGDITIFHFALPSPMTDRFAALNGAKILQYHNITPAAFFAPYDAGLFRLAALGRRELATLAGRVDLALGDSEFNRRELEALGFAPTGVLPIAVDTERITGAPPRPALERILADGLINILFVGRIVPNKKIEDHIRLAELYKRTSTATIASSSSEGTTACRDTTRRFARSSPSSRCCRIASGSPDRCRTRISRPSIAGRTPTCR